MEKSLFAREDWYRKLNAPSLTFEGIVRRKGEKGVFPMMRFNPLYLERAWSSDDLYLGSHAGDLDEFVGKPVRITGKWLQFELEGRRVREIAPARIATLAREPDPVDGIVRWLKGLLRRTGRKGFVVGLSGGIDSCVVAALCSKAAPGSLFGVMMPCDSAACDLDDAARFATQFAIPSTVVDLEPVFDRYLETVGASRSSDPVTRLALANIKPRLRMMTLYYHANMRHSLVMGTGNRSEFVMGYFTKYGDGGADAFPIGDFSKTKVRALAQMLGVPAEIIEKPPSAGLWKGQTDESEMGITYEVLDAILDGRDTGDLSGIDPGAVAYVDSVFASTQHKRCSAPVYRAPR